MSWIRRSRRVVTSVGDLRGENLEIGLGGGKGNVKGREGRERKGRDERGG